MYVVNKYYSFKTFTGGKAMAKIRKEVVTYKSKEVRTVKERTTLRKVAKGAVIVGGVVLAATLLSGNSEK